MVFYRVDQNAPISPASPDEAALHHALGLWAAEHAARYPEVAVLPHEPASFPAQRLDVAKTEPTREIDGLPPEELKAALRERYERVIGRDAVAALEGIQRLAPDVAALLRGGGSLAVLTAHVDGLHDIGMFCGGLAAALADAALIRRNGSILNKVMSRETFRGQPIASLFGLFGNVYWVIPETDSARRFGIPAELASSINRRAMQALLADLRSGGVSLTLAPSGSAMRARRDGAGTLEALEMPAIAAGTAHLIGRFDAYVTAVLWQGRIRIGPLERIAARQAKGRAERAAAEAALADRVAAEIAAAVEELAGVPVRQVADPA